VSQSVSESPGLLLWFSHASRRRRRRVTIPLLVVSSWVVILLLHSGKMGEKNGLLPAMMGESRGISGKN